MAALVPFLTGPAGLGLLSMAVAALLGVLAWRSLDPETKPAQAPAAIAERAPPAAPAEPAPGAQSQQQAGPAAVPAAPPAQAAAPDGKAPEFDLVRVEPTGEAVVAGRAAPGSIVRLRSAGETLGQATADPNGQFVILPKDLPAGDHLLSLDIAPAAGGAEASSKQTVSVRVPPGGKGEVVIALTAPDQPTKILSDGLKPSIPPDSRPAPQAARPDAVAAAPAAGAAQVDAALKGPADIVIRSVEAEEGGAFYASGAATPGADVRLYLNGSYVAEVRPGPDGRWSLRIEKGMVPGQYAVRADLSAPGSPKVAARAEVPFLYEAAPKQVASAPVVPVGGQAETLPPVTAQNGAAGDTSKPEAKPDAVKTVTARIEAGTPEAAKPEIAKPEIAKPEIAKPETGKPETGKPETGKPETGKPDAPKADAVVSQIQTATVVRGDSLWRISRQVYGHGLRYTQIYRANESQIRDPDMIYPGQVLVVPKEPGKTE